MLVCGIRGQLVARNKMRAIVPTVRLGGVARSAPLPIMRKQSGAPV